MRIAGSTSPLRVGSRFKQSCKLTNLLSFLLVSHGAVVVQGMCVKFVKVVFEKRIVFEKDGLVNGLEPVIQCGCSLIPYNTSSLSRQIPAISKLLVWSPSTTVHFLSHPSRLWIFAPHSHQQTPSTSFCLGPPYSTPTLSHSYRECIRDGSRPSAGILGR
jgi:hypothetical protein